LLTVNGQNYWILPIFSLDLENSELFEVNESKLR
jgi:hypothetical protein